MIKGDSAEYKLLAKWVNELPVTDFTVSLEIGVRQGYSTQVIMDNVIGPNFHIGIDPYGDIKYKHVDPKEGSNLTGKMLRVKSWLTLMVVLKLLHIQTQ